MRVVRSVKEMQSISETLRKTGKTIGFIPTMGYLHDGHMSLVERARKENDVVVMSIFVNPVQFAPGEDFERYPRDIERDKKIAQEKGVDYLFVPEVSEMYPEGYSTYVEVEGITEVLCGAKRPGHFRGVATVVTKLFNIVKPHRAYFGKKDFQQLKVIERLVRDLNFDVEVIGCPIVREEDGLAMSSRNVYLSPEERESATSLYRALKLAKELIEKGERNPETIKSKMEEFILSHPHVKAIDYIEIVDSETLKPVDEIKEGTLIALAVFVGNARLIDNWVVGERI
ncbi:pantoate--beta-alanine ligase [Phorcysia thermohydrogeniphila]|uniref:Pantothenate synthetase n=1 Tax=Phorcysia thermohydrogeniphila TaxID=936138 RepID=A0A4R1G9E9_9BACT|nr:pantoate--beta-alanine ligase [Phorcysia thermohydrogeniphila]TCK04504.1 pantoate--beta-alanine ligase [Phorcysia thermohydrogeniphila]